MAILKKGSNGFRGKLGNTVTYNLKGQSVQRLIGEITKPPTELQLINRKKMAIVTEFLKPVKEFVRIGFEVETKRTLLSPYNKATSLNILNSIKGIYPNQEIDFTKAVFSKGRMPVTEDIKVTHTDTGLKFVWDPDLKFWNMKPTDHLMLIAYCAEKKQAFCQLDGAKRKEGKEKLNLPRYNKQVVIHVYTAFVSSDHKIISDSVYHGEMIW